MAWREDAKPLGAASVGRVRSRRAWSDLGRRMWPATLGIACYVVLAMALYGDLNPASTTTLPLGGGGDITQEVWFLAWPFYAVTHLMNPLFSSYINYPSGVNLMNDTSMPVLGFLMLPVTALGGPLAAFNVLIRLGFVVSASTMFLVLRRFTTWWPAAFAGGLLYGFSPYMIGQGYSHAFLVFVPFPPLVLLLLHELFVRQQGSAWVPGLGLGVAAALQFGISAETLAMTGFVAACCTAALVLRHPVGAAERLRHAVVGLLFSGAAFVVLAGYPLWFYFRGTNHIHGPPHPVVGLLQYRADLEAALFPTVNQRLGPASWIARGTSYAHLNIVEDGIYLGIPLLLVLTLLVLRARREGIVQLAAFVTLGCYLLALGDKLVVNNHYTAVMLPFQYLLHLPVVDDVVALRFSLFVMAGAAVVLAVGLDRLRTEGLVAPPRSRRRRPASVPITERMSVVTPAPAEAAERGGRRDRLLRAGLCVLVAAVALVPLLPRRTFRPAPPGWPTYFTTGVASGVPAGSVLLPYPNPGGPYGVPPVVDAMGWQSVQNMRFKIIGAYATVAGPDGTARAGTTDLYLPPVIVQVLFDWALYGKGSGLVPPPFTPATFAAIRQYCIAWHVSTVVVEPTGARPATLVAYLKAAIGPPSALDGGVAVWYDVARRLAR